MMTQEYYPNDPSNMSGAAGFDVSDDEIAISRQAGLAWWFRPNDWYEPSTGQWDDRVFERPLRPLIAGVAPGLVTPADFASKPVFRLGDAGTNLGGFYGPGLLPVAESFSLALVVQPDAVNTAAYVPLWGDSRGTAQGSYVDVAPDGTFRWRIGKGSGTTSIPVANSPAGQPRVPTLLICSFAKAEAGPNTARMRLIRKGAAVVNVTNANVASDALNSDPELHIGHCGTVPSTNFINRNGAYGDILGYRGRAILESAAVTDVAVVLRYLQGRYDLVPTA